MSDMTPVDIEREINRLKNATAGVYGDLRQARVDEIDAKHRLKRANVFAINRVDCPRVSRTGVTVADRDAWLYEQIADEEYAADMAEVSRKNAEDAVRELQLQASLTQTEARSVFQAYAVAGRGES